MHVIFKNKIVSGVVIVLKEKKTNRNQKIYIFIYIETLHDVV